MNAALLDHLWQSTLFAGCAWLVTSIKFLVPFSLLAMLGEQLAPSPTPLLRAQQVGA